MEKKVLWKGRINFFVKRRAKTKNKRKMGHIGALQGIRTLSAYDIALGFDIASFIGGK